MRQETSDGLVRPWRIVIAEDNPTDLKMVRRSLSKHKIRCQLLVLADGKQAFDFIKKIDSDFRLPTPDLVLLDLDLPLHNGHEVFQKIRGSERCGQTPVIIMTGSVCPDDKASAKKYAAGHYFQKTADFDAFMKIGEIIKKALEEKLDATRRRQRGQ